MASFVLGARLLLAAVFATAAGTKLLDPLGSRRALADFGVPERALPAAVLLLPFAEAAAAVALVPRPTALWGALAALVLLGIFVAGIANAMRRGQAPDCHCFGQLHSAPAGRATLARNAALAAFAVVVLLEGPGPALDGWVGARTAAELVAVGLGAAAAVLAALSVRLLLENRQLRRAVAAAPTAVRPGLPIGVAAPAFGLRRVSGETVTLEQLLTRGRPLALIFVSPDCGPCQTLFPEVERWQAALADRLTVAIVSQGTPEENRPVIEKHGISKVLLQEDSEVMTAYQLQGTPSAVVVSREGMIASNAAAGAFAVEALIRLTLQREAAAPVASTSAA